jgi:hypothetical protein
MKKRAARTELLYLRPRGAGEGTMRSMVEGAHASKLRLQCRTIDYADAPSTTLLRSVVPLPRLRGAGGVSASVIAGLVAGAPLAPGRS